jgi:hypothetical protein
MARPHGRTTNWHPVQTIRPIQWAFPRPGTRQRFAVITHVQRSDGWVFEVVTVAGVKLGPFSTLDDAARGVHTHALANAPTPPYTGYPTHNMGGSDA